MDVVNAESSVPLYKQIVRGIMGQIEEGAYRDGDKLPTEAELMERFGVSRITVRAAIKELEDAELVERTRGKGTFVTLRRQAYTADDREGFTRSCALAGKKPSTVVLRAAWIYPSLRDMGFLNVQEDENIFQSRRLRMADGEPAVLETNSYAPELGFLEREDLSGSLTAILGRRRVSLGAGERTFRTCCATAYEAECLKVEEGSALLLFVDKRLSASGAPLFISRQVYCTERLRFCL